MRTEERKLFASCKLTASSTQTVLRCLHPLPLLQLPISRRYPPRRQQRQVTLEVLRLRTGHQLGGGPSRHLRPVLEQLEVAVEPEPHDKTSAQEQLLSALGSGPCGLAGVEFPQ
eukprot:759154-Hanusia_phi.AAC.4